MTTESYTKKSVREVTEPEKKRLRWEWYGGNELEFKLDLSYSVSELNIPCWKKIHLGAPGLQ